MFRALLLKTTLKKMSCLAMVSGCLLVNGLPGPATADSANVQVAPNMLYKPIELADGSKFTQQAFESSFLGYVEQKHEQAVQSGHVLNQLAQATYQGVRQLIAWAAPAPTPLPTAAMDELEAELTIEMGMIPGAAQRLMDSVSSLETDSDGARAGSNTLPPLMMPKFRVPMDYPYVISSHFGMRDGRPHEGTDYVAPYGSAIYAAQAGHVIYAGWESGYGKTIVIDHGDGVKTRYAHCSKLLVKVNTIVQAGARIAKLGNTGRSTGAHLHFEVIVHDVPQDPVVFMANQPDLPTSGKYSVSLRTPIQK